jgi:hypothetical protein
MFTCREGLYISPEAYSWCRWIQYANILDISLISSTQSICRAVEGFCWGSSYADSADSSEVQNAHFVASMLIAEWQN